MIAILLYHTEYYYTGKVLTNYSLYVTNALILFFFVSGYLMYLKSATIIQYTIKGRFMSR